MNRFLPKILVLISLTILSLPLMAQEYTPLDISEGSTWSHTECGFKPNWGAVYKFKIFGDTLIHNETYKKLYFQAKRGAGICSTCNFTFNRDSSTLFAFIRQSIPKRKVYFICPSISDKEWLGYDFDISSIGQTVTGFSLILTVDPEGPAAGIYVYQMIVDAIDSICVNGEYVRRYYYGPGNGGNIYHLAEYWVEGIGSTHGLMVQGFGGPDWNHSLYCFHNKDGSVYYDYDAILDCIDNTSLTCEEGYDCSPYTSIDPGNSESAINIYPNPAKDKIFIESKSPSGTLTLTLFNMMGQKSLTKTIRWASELEPVNIGELPPGFYYLTLEAEGFFSGCKIIKE
ncbi:MAG: T9SS type A sorting domain-containing protein [Bacteroidales bacterium]|nr:T9SS type A sorting domain-containing protein [Bacteroidales bacterium]